MGQNRVFFPQDTLDRWLSEGTVDLTDRELVFKGYGRRYRIVEAVRVLGEVSGHPDPFDITGRVKSVSFVTELGAELLETSMILGDSAFDVVPGFLGTPQGTYEQARTAGAGAPRPGRKRAAEPQSDEELLWELAVSGRG